VILVIDASLIHSDSDIQAAAAALVKEKGTVQMIKELGLKGLYKGSSACFLRDIPFSGIYFSSYAWLKEKLRKGNEPLHSAELLVCASLAGNDESHSPPPHPTKCNLSHSETFINILILRSGSSIGDNTCRCVED